MNYLIDIGHPAHVHLFRNLYFRLKESGHKVIVTTKNIPSAVKLLEQYKIDFIGIGAKADGLFNKFLKQFFFTRQLIKIIKKEKIDITLGVSITISHASLFTRSKSIVFDDDDFNATPLFALSSHLFANNVLVPDCCKTMSLKKIKKYPGYHELAYLHPKIFQPDESIWQEMGLQVGDPYFVLRFNSFKAHHDIKASGLSDDNKQFLIKILSKAGRVFISGEDELIPEFRNYKLPVPLEKIHSVLYYATFLVSDSQTMTSEAAVLGTPSLRLNSFVGKISYLKEQEEKYGLTYGFYPYQFNELVNKIEELLSYKDLNETWKKKRALMHKDKIDVTAFFVWFFENYPSSVDTMKKEPDYAYNFL
ncbi:MAG: DUF354 domain-containing protein [Bacteroidales bacterium]|nr:DUF354 domain-containing protein [Bacteroidales bacterium]MCF8402560.1 DUF354 domain-containing protein [Bacteroidales bacterium]